MSTKGQIPSPLRYCASCALTLLLWAVWLALGALLAMQAYVAVAKDLPVPGFVLRRIESSLAAQDISVRFGAAHFDPAGRILLENVQLRLRNFEEPVFSSRLVYARKNIWSVLAGRTVPDEVNFEGATLQLPAIFSPSGTAEPLLREISGEIRFVPGEIHIDQVSFHVGTMPVTITGVMAPPRNLQGKPLGAATAVSRFLQYGRQVALLLPRLQAADHPALRIEATPRPQGGTNLAMLLTADGVHDAPNLPVDLGKFAVTAHWAWDGVRPHPMRIHAAMHEIDGPRETKVENLRATVRLEPPSMEFAAVAWADASVAADRVEALGENWENPVISATFSVRDAAGDFTAALKSHDEVFAVAGEGNLREKSARIDAAGRIPPLLVSGLLARYGPKLEPYFRLADPIGVVSETRFGPGWKFAGFTSQVNGGRMDSHGVGITSARGRIDIDAGLNFLAHDAQLVAGENVARGSYWMNFHTANYRMLLTGRLRPPDISGWFRGEWWTNFWANFSFPMAPPQADVDVQGCWKNPRLTSYFGSTDAVRPVVLGADFERARARIFVRPQFAHVLELAVERGGGTQRATGSFTRTAVYGAAPPTSTVDYDFTGNLDLATYKKMGGEAAEKLLDDLKFDQPPQVHVEGHTDVAEGKAVHHGHFTGETQGGMQYAGFPVDGLSIAGTVNGEDLTLDRVDFGFAKGHGRARVGLTGDREARRLSLEGTLQDADLARTILAVEDFENTRTGTKGKSVAGSKFIKRASGGKFDLTLSAQGATKDLINLRGTGSAQLSGTELGEIHLFGLLSQVLSAVALNFSSLKLDAARTTFQLGDGRIHFPDIKVTGPTAAIDAKGDYLLESKTLDFTAKLKPYEETHNPLTAVVGMVMNPLTSIFELKLTGPLAKPTWSVTLGQGPKPEAPAVPTPGAAEAKSGSAVEPIPVKDASVAEPPQKR